MRQLKLGRAFTLIEPGPVVLRGLAAYQDTARSLDRRRMMASRLPAGL